MQGGAHDKPPWLTPFALTPLPFAGKLKGGLALGEPVAVGQGPRIEDVPG